MFCRVFNSVEEVDVIGKDGTDCSLLIKVEKAPCRMSYIVESSWSRVKLVIEFGLLERHFFSLLLHDCFASYLRCSHPISPRDYKCRIILKFARKR